MVHILRYIYIVFVCLYCSFQIFISLNGRIQLFTVCGLKYTRSMKFSWPKSTDSWDPIKGCLELNLVLCKSFKCSSLLSSIYSNRIAMDLNHVWNSLSQPMAHIVHLNKLYPFIQYLLLVTVSSGYTEALSVVYISFWRHFINLCAHRPIEHAITYYEAMYVLKTAMEHPNTSVYPRLLFKSSFLTASIHRSHHVDIRGKGIGVGFFPPTLLSPSCNTGVNLGEISVWEEPLPVDTCPLLLFILTQDLSYFPRQLWIAVWLFQS